MHSFNLIYCLLVIVVLSNRQVDAKKRNNACKTFQDYYQPDNNANCFFNPDMYLETADLIKKYAGSVEIYEVPTEDGYFLALYRIPRKNPKGTIFLQHPLGVDARVWVGQGKEALGFFLWEQGYDVWLSNQRGTLASTKHVNMSSTEFSYWNFSFHEIGVYDDSAVLNFISERTGGAKVVLIGHSMGTTEALIYATMKPKEAQKNLKALVLVSTACYYPYNTNPVMMFTSFAPLLRIISQQLKLGSVYLVFLPLFYQITKMASRMFPFILLVINLGMSLSCGWTPDEMDPTLLNFDSAIYLKNMSFKVLVHFLQLMASKTGFQMFDYGKSGNLKLYGTEEPPSYPLQDISVPILFISSENDTLTTAKDAQALSEVLPKDMRLGHLIVTGLNHADFHMGRHRKEIFFWPLLNRLEEIFSRN